MLSNNPGSLYGRSEECPLKIIIKSKIPKKRRRLREALSRGHGSFVPNEHGALSEVEVTSLALAYQRGPLVDGILC